MLANLQPIRVPCRLSRATGWFAALPTAQNPQRNLQCSAKHRLLACATAACGLLLSLLSFQAYATADTAASGEAGLQQTYESLRASLRDSPFGKPLTVRSSQRGNELRGDVYAVIDQPFATVEDSLRPAAHWCEILMLHLNTKGCAVRTGGQTGSGAADSPAGGTSIEVAVGSKHEEPVDHASAIALGYRVAAASPVFLDIRMRAKDGPMGTHDYQLGIQATPVEGGHTFIHLHYAYGFGMAASLAMKGYLATVGRDKVGFTHAGTETDDPVGGVRGVVERNAMRYYLAIDAYLDSLSLPPDRQRDARTAAWFDATARYPQLHEIDRDEYLTMKRHELARLPRTP